MPEWFVEDGIGEIRALLIERGEVLAARLCWSGERRAGDVLDAQLVTRRQGSRRGVAQLADATQVLVDNLPPSATEGVQGRVRLTRAAIAERGRFKRAQGRWMDDATGPSETKPPFADATRVNQFEPGAWEEVWHAASSGTLAFPGGTIVCSATPAMTVIDIDGDAAPRELSLAAIPAIVRALHWFDIGGSVGLDFPTLAARADRRAVDAALGAALDDAGNQWTHERTAMNGFGFVHLVARLEGPSLLHRFAAARLGLCARAALRVAERTAGPGVTELTVHPALKAKLKPEWLDELVRRTAREVRIATDPGLALEAPQAQIVKR